MRYRLGPAARAQGHRLHVHDTLGSTNTEAMAQARAGETGPLWVVTHRQEAGRGRRGNSWASLPGNLAASVLWPVVGVPPDHLAELGFVAGVALIEALAAACGTLPDTGSGIAARSVMLKWPSDVLLGGVPAAPGVRGGAEPAAAVGAVGQPLEVRHGTRSCPAPSGPAPHWGA